MGITERKERQRAELREQILAAARAIVFEEGFEALTMRKIADAIEYSPATIYLHFENREAIGRQLCAEAFEKLLSYFAPVRAIADPAERLRAMGRAYARFAFENPEWYKLIFMTDEKYLAEIFGERQYHEEGGQRAFDLVVDTVREGIASGSIAEQDPVLLAEAVWSGVHGVVSLQLTCAKVLESPVDRIIETLVVALTKGIAP
ncbi:MAG TPA: TetR/AcrR family transcriptional regulator [Candidatus Acidoferrum sp.]|nr:TetR/AcrR family transcriptional regulator [Candidatus Acidoferrum sp.]